jgi:hypothetical protein|tara:strand:- start:42 stop:473 length:432 start_codon:yes stop_codon:yes gene_type:complete
MVNSNRKGKRGELEVARTINKKFDSNVRRTPNSGGLSIKGDIIDINPDSPLYNYHFEIKNTQKVLMTKWWKQATDDCRRGKTPVLIFKMNHNWHSVLDFDDFLNTIKEIDDLKKELKETKFKLENRDNAISRLLKNQIAEMKQ